MINKGKDLRLSSSKLIIWVIFVLSINILNFGQQKKPVVSPTIDDFLNELSQVPCKNEDRLEGVKKLFKKKGANETDIKVEKINQATNASVMIKGLTDEIIVVGAHYDETGGGCGAIDNWSGIIILANLYGTMKNFKPQKTYQFVAFDKEEKGLIGSREMAGAIPKEKRAMYCSMVNFDSFGLSYPQVSQNNSNKKLISLAEEIAKKIKIPFQKARIANADSDSTAFNEIKIPAISFHGLSNRWEYFLHTSRDSVNNVKIKSVYFGYQFGLKFVTSLDNQSCLAFRKRKN